MTEILKSIFRLQQQEVSNVFNEISELIVRIVRIFVQFLNCNTDLFFDLTVLVAKYV